MEVSSIVVKTKRALKEGHESFKEIMSDVCVSKVTESKMILLIN